MGEKTPRKAKSGGAKDGVGASVLTSPETSVNLPIIAGKEKMKDEWECSNREQMTPRVSENR